MERLTYKENGKWWLRIGDTEFSGKEVDCLAAYEDTGLAPEEIQKGKQVYGAAIGELAAPNNCWCECGDALQLATDEDGDLAIGCFGCQEYVKVSELLKLANQSKVVEIDQVKPIETDRDKPNPYAVYKKALQVYGKRAQTLMVMEEMAELQKELCKHARGKQNREQIAEEIADVLIMLEQMMILHGCESLVRSYRIQKVQRLENRLQKEATP